MSDEYWAHNLEGLPHRLDEHLVEVGRRASIHAQHFGAVWGHMAGVWLDLGKYRSGFQTYIRLTTDAHIEGKLPSRSDKSHSAAGALHAIETLRQHFGPHGERVGRLLAYVIAGHHAGLADWTAGLDSRLLGTGAPDSQREYDEARTACEVAALHLLALPENFDLRSALTSIPGILLPNPQDVNPLAWSLWVRMLFSALVDADFLDTEAFMDDGKSAARDRFAPIENYRAQLDTALTRMAEKVVAEGRAHDRVMRARADVLQRCREQALQAPGVFSLEVPTGGGKTCRRSHLR